ncbi:MAG: ribosome recycling factor [Deltaproteobacteria bacterium]|nr:ribosome recycling factor [Deltaproteobacteria bacterium]
METILKSTQVLMEKSIALFKQEIAKIRSGRASLSILDDVKVDYYGNVVPLNQVATLNTPDPRMITIQPWEPKMISEIEKALLKASLGLNPTNDGKMVRLAVPSPTEERRKELVKIAKKYGEDAKVAVRMERRTANDQIKKLHDKKELSDDDFKKGQDKIQKLTDDYVKKIDDLLTHKEKDIMSL